MSSQKVFLHTFGCKANQYDTELLRTRFEDGGAVFIQEPDQADLCVVNSCSVTAAADRECRQFVRRLLRTNSSARIVVTGCYATHAPQELQEISPRVEVYSNQQKKELPSCVGFEVNPDIFGLSRYSTRSRAFVKIQDGCQAPCRYCIIPTTRPNLWSKPVDHILKEVGSLISEGHEEVVFTGIRLGLYRGDSLNLVQKLDLVGLLKKVIKIPGKFRIRLSSLEVTEVSDELIKLVSSTDKICRHFHIPMQSGEDHVLKEMGRWYSYSQYKERIQFIKEVIPDCGLTADVLVGFPAETAEFFQITYDRIKELELTGLHAFPFSVRPGTKASSLEPLSQSVVKERTLRLISLSDQLKLKFYERFKGTEREVLVEPSHEGWTDNYIRVKTPKNSPLGQLTSVKI